MKAFVTAAVLLCLAVGVRAADLQKFTEVRLVENPSNDGDSFVVQAGERTLHLRLYFVDCPESVATTDADAKRVREQARFFGITDAKKILEFGRAAKTFMQRTLSEPFTVYTSFASALGRSPGGRVYAFVVTGGGQDLGQSLVENGFARAFGAKRSGPEGTSSKKIQQELEKLETSAMLKHQGIWAATDPGVIDKLRAEQRAEDLEIKDVLKASAGKDAQPGSIELNTATSRELQSISGVGPVLAARIVEGRPYRSVDDLLRVPGVGSKLLDKIRPYFVVNTPAGSSK